jgi:periplasmic protein TonB
MAISIEQGRLILPPVPMRRLGLPARGPDPSRSVALLAVILIHAAGIGGLLAATVSSRHAVPETVSLASLIRETPAPADEDPSLPLPREWRPLLPDVPVPQVAIERSTAITVPPPSTVTLAVAAMPRPTDIEGHAPPLLDAQAVGYLVPPAPHYPPASRRLCEEGEVLVRVLIDAEGRPREIDVLRSSGHARLDEAAIEAVRAALFRPYVAQGRAHAAYVRVPVEFALRRS